MSRRPNETEQEYQARLTMERQRSVAQERNSHVADADRERQKQLHWMRCPKCGAELSEVQFRDVKLDKCFACAGVFLDDGELEQLTGKPGWFDSMLRFFRN
ncbi:zf-TFIIB domain-containing protein [Nannocystis sp.]|uniref:TFIIB-type zinc ribbon-containing protein n=1 Tax=Nannocystis sp. TaxID=1962667 RepID=UPI002420DA83|nr:zf-TFIIB domain-containing protein [Nannocystis sp.]MBK7828269.1 zf-TFIIB domain-containing protein [Nannocystis sp.]MBK9757392.1 zf-TFIIB domain-containing protein [Nannocystis sp.]